MKYRVWGGPSNMFWRCFYVCCFFKKRGFSKPSVLLWRELHFEGSRALFWSFFGYFLVFFLGFVFDTFLEHVEFDMQITILSGPRASYEYLKNSIFRSNKCSKRSLKESVIFSRFSWNVTTPTHGSSDFGGLRGQNNKNILFFVHFFLSFFLFFMAVC